MEDTLYSISLMVDPDKQSAGYKLFYIHLTAMFLMPLLFVGVTMLRIPIAISYFPLFIYHILGKGCPVTRVERKLHGEDKTVIDVFLSAVGLSVTNKNRNRMLVFLSTGIMLCMAYVISIMSN